MPDLHGYENLLLIGLVTAIVGTAVTIWIRWEDRRKRPPSTPQPIAKPK